MCRRTEEEVGPTVWLPRHIYLVGFFVVPVQEPTRGHSVYSFFPRKRPISVAFYACIGERRTYSHLKPRVPTGVKVFIVNYNMT